MASRQPKNILADFVREPFYRFGAIPECTETKENQRKVATERKYATFLLCLMNTSSFFQTSIAN